MSSLCLPDICGYINHPRDSVGKRYKGWFDSYMPQSYHGYISASEAYALQCIVLHNGELALTQFTNRSPNKNIILDKFELFKDGIHLLRSTGNKVNGIETPNLVRINVSEYCKDIISGVQAWEKASGKGLGEYDEVFVINDGSTSFSL